MANLAALRSKERRVRPIETPHQTEEKTVGTFSGKMSSVAPGFVLRQITAFLDEALTQPDLRHRILSATRRRLPSADPTTLQALSLVSHALDSFPSFSSPSPSPSPSKPSPSALRAAENLLLSLARHTPLSALLLAIARAARRRPAEAANALLDLFILDPSAARNDLAPPVFEELFIPHLLPVIQWFADQRSRILSSDYSVSVADYDDEKSIEAAAAMSLLSRMSGRQAEELKELEREYEKVLDVNTRAYAEYLKEVLRSVDGSRKVGRPPQLVLARINSGGGIVEEEEEVVEYEEEGRLQFGSRNGRYNPIWAEADQAVKSPCRDRRRGQNNNAKAPHLYPQRVPPHLLIRQPSNESVHAASSLTADSGPGFYSDDNSEDLASEVDPEIEDKNTKVASFEPNQLRYPQQEESSMQSNSSSSTQMVDSDSVIAFGKQTPPKDFVCPITSNLFNDPVTLETGQTYERKAIQEWLDRGNITCPITRQKLQSTQLPKTNYVLKRLIATWLEQNPSSTPTRLENAAPKNILDPGLPMRSPSPTSVISQASSDGATGDLRLAISRLCTSEILNESEMAVLQIERFWRDSSAESEILTVLSKPAVVNGFVEILFNSANPQVLRSTVFLLSELASKDKFVVQTLTRVDSDVECMVALFKKGLVEAVALIYLLNPSWESLIAMDMVEALMMVIKKKEEEPCDLCVKPRTASIVLLSQILRGDHRDVSALVGALISGRTLESIIPSLQAELVEERIAVVRLLLRCMEEDGNCRNFIADKAELAPVLEILATVSDVERFEIVCFLAELVKLSRRTFNEQLLYIIKDEGAFSTMHTLLVYLQTAIQDQLPVIAGLLLQLDLLVEPRRMSIYREEAIDALISCLRNPEFPSCQLLAAEMILVLQGRFSPSGKPLARAFLLKRAGMNKSYRALMRTEQMNYVLGNSEDNLEEEKAADDWERKTAYALVSHEFGLLLEALSEGLMKRNTQISSACLVSATWLSHMLSTLPDTGIRGAARMCLLKHFVSILKSTTHTDDKALAMLALRSFMHDSDGLHDLTLHVKDVLKSLRELKKTSVLAYEMLKLFSDGQESSIDMWNHQELVQVDCSTHGEVLSLVSYRNRIFSGHSDGTIKVWSSSQSLHVVQETHEHSKAVTSLAILHSGDKLYSGSLDKSVRVWSIRGGEIQCIEVHDMKDQVNNLIVANTIACFIPQGTGVKVLSWNGGSKLLNPSKHVKCLALEQGKLYCGCHDSSIQEIDLATGTLGTIQSGNKKLLAKSNPIYALQVHDGLIYSASAYLDGAAVKIWNASNCNLVGSLPSTNEVRTMTMSTELIYLGCKMGTVEIWSKDKLIKVGTLQAVTNGKVQCMAVDADGEILVVGTSDGKIQAWGLT